MTPDPHAQRDPAPDPEPAFTPAPAVTAASTAPGVDVGDLWDNGPCGYLATTTEGHILAVNSTLARMLGYPPGALVGTAFTDLLGVGSRIHYETHFAAMLRLRGDLQGITVDLVAADGTRHPVFLTASARTDADGRPTALRITTQDARDRRAYDRELLASRKRAERESARARELATTLQR